MDVQPFAEIVFDIPADTDAFDGKGHDRSSKALAEGIDQVFRNGGGAIGLEGSWGSGKSTVIRMAEKRLVGMSDSSGGSTMPSYHVFTFDLWTHQTDEFRRAFLERFLDYLEVSNFAQNVNLDKERDRIRNRKKQVVNENRNQYTPTGAFILLVIPFLPILYAWLNPVAFVNAATLNAMPWIATVVAAAAVAIVVDMIRDGYQRLPDDQRKTKRTPFEKFGLAASEFLTISKNVRSETSTQWIRDEDPTTVEFQRTFQELLNQVQRADHRLVFVLDNIDRLSKDAVKDAWSEMRALITGRRAGVGGPVVVVVPYDRSTILRAISEETEKSPKDDAERKTASGDPDLFTKTFDRILRVSPPIGSHWVGFLETVLERAFGDQLSEPTVFRLFRVLQYHLQQAKQLPTPRRIVGYVNELGAYWTQWGDKIPVEAIAIFVLLRSEIERYFTDIASETLDLTPYQKITRGENLLRDLAALYFNVEKDMAEEVLLAGPLATALVADTSDELRKLRSVPGFDRFFPRLLPECVAPRASQVRVLAAVARNVASLKLEGPLADDVAVQLADFLPRVDDLDPFESEDMDNDLLEIVRMQPLMNVHPAREVIEAKVDRALKASKENDLDKGYAYASYALRLAEIVSTRFGAEQGQHYWKSVLHAAAPAEFALGFAHFIEGNGSFHFAQLADHLPAQQLVTALEPYIDRDTRLVHDVLKELTPLLSLEMKIALESKMAARLKAAVLNEEDAGYLLRACSDLYVGVEGDMQITSVVQKLVADGTALFYGRRAAEANDHGVVAAALLLSIAQFQGEPPASAIPVHSTLGAMTESAAWYQQVLTSGDVSEDTIEALAVGVSQLKSFGLWLGWAATSVSDGLFKKVIRRMTETGQLGVVWSVAFANLTKHLDRIVGRFGAAEAQAIVKRVGDSLSGDGFVKDEDLLEIPAPVLARYEEWAPNTPLASVATRIDAKFRSMSASDWYTSLSKEDAATNILVARIATTALTLKGESYLGGYKSHALDVLAGTASIGMSSDRWIQLYSAVPQNSRRALASAVLREIGKKGASPSGAVQFVKFFPQLAASLPLSEFPEPSIDILLRALVVAGDEAARAFVRANIKVFKKALAKAQEGKTEPSEVGAAFNDIIEGLENGDQASVVWAEELRKGLGLHRPPAKDEDEVGA